MDEHLSNIIKKFSYVLSTYSGYFLLSHALDKYNDKFSKVNTFTFIALYLLIVTISLAITRECSVNIGLLSSLLYGDLLLSSCVETVIIFLRIRNNFKEEMYF